MNTRELLAERQTKLDAAKALNVKAEAEKRDFLPEEQTQWDALQGEIKALDNRIARSNIVFGDPIKPEKAPAVITRNNDTLESAIAAYVRTGDNGGVRHLLNDKGAVEIRASNATDMNVTTAADGGVLVPTGFVNTIIAKRTEMSLAERIGVRRIPGVGTTVDVPYDNEADGEFVSTGEGSGYDLDAPALAKKSLTLVDYTKYIKLSNQLLRDEDANLNAFLTDWIARGQAKTMNNLLNTEVTTNGTLLKTAADDTTITVGDLEGVVYNAYVTDFLDDGGSIAWVMRPATYGAIISVTGSPRVYAETPIGRSDRRLLEYPVYYSNKVAAIAATAKSALFGNWNYVGWRESPGLTLLRDPYSNASTGQVTLWMTFGCVFGVLQPYAVGWMAQAASN
jgi:HK97 family phage major capsid protein